MTMVSSVRQAGRIHRTVRSATPRRGHPAGESARLYSVSVVIPTMNEAENLPHVLPHIPSDMLELVIVDGASTDGTVDVARALWPGVKIVRQRGVGKGNALLAGFEACEGDIIVMLDADGSTDPAEIPRFVDSLTHGFDFVKGSRYCEGGGSSDLTPLRSLGNRVLTGLVNRLFGTAYTDLCYGYCAFWRGSLASLFLDCDGFEIETLMNIRAARAGLRVAEVASFERPRIYGSSNLRVVRDGARVLRTILEERLALRRTDQGVSLGRSAEIARRREDRWQHHQGLQRQRERPAGAESS
jgi:glycosyltransferase involved in cell wall biosynthesis